MVQIIDSGGKAHEAIIAEQSLSVTDPLTGVTRKVIAGQPVSGDLEDAYQAALDARGKKSARRRRRKTE